MKSGYRLIVFDMDGVLVNTNSSWVVVHDYFGVNNLKSLELYLERKIDDMEFMRRDIALWKRCDPQIDISKIEKILSTVEFNPNIRKIFDFVKNNDMKSVIVSGGIDLLAERVQNAIGCDYYWANGLETDESGKLTGEGILRVPVLDKDMIVRKAQEMYGIDKSRTVAVGNSHVDVKLFREADLGIAFNPEDEIIKNAAAAILEGNDLGELIEILNGWTDK
jgi:phosphoserine phosphatase